MKTKKPLLLLGIVCSALMLAAPVVAGSKAELVLAISSLGNESLDPMAGPTDSQTHLNSLYDHLVGVNRECTKLSTETGLAKKWESSPDKMTWTFYLRKGVLFHDGKEATADDVHFSIKRCIGPESITAFAGTLRKIIKEIEVTKPYELTIRLSHPNFSLPYYFSRLVGTEGMIVPKHYIDKVGDQGFREHPIASGPYKFVDRKMGAYMTYEAIDRHWAIGVPKFKRLTFRLVPELSTRIAMLKTGEADVIDVSRDKIRELKAAGFSIVEKKDAMILHLYMQMAKPSPLDDVRVREAMVISVNRAELVKYIFQGAASLSENLIPSWQVSGYKPLPLRPYDPEKAKKLLKEAGYPDGFKLTIYSFPKAGLPEAKSVGEALAGYYKKIGVKCEIVHSDYGTYRGQWVAKALNYPAITVHGIGNRMFSDVHARAIWHSKGKLISTRSGVPEFDAYDALIEEWGKVSNLKEYGESVVKVERHRYEQWISAPILTTSAVFAASDKVKTDWGMGIHPYAINVYDLFWGE